MSTPPPPAPVESMLNMCVGLWGMRECRCCTPARRRPRAAEPIWPARQGKSNGSADSVVDAMHLPDSTLYVDTHCHLEEVLQAAQRCKAVPSLCKMPNQLTAQEKKLWAALGWGDSSSSDANAASGDSAGGGEAVGGDADDAAGAGNAVETRKRKQAVEKMWGYRWFQLTPEQQKAAIILGWNDTSWDESRWLLGKDIAWDDLGSDVQRALEVLGESSETWDEYSPAPKKACSEFQIQRQEHASKLVDGNSGVMAERPWKGLSAKERAAAVGLGFTRTTWECTEMADIGATIDEFFGPGFEACITQGCDWPSIPYAKKLCLAHPKVFASFGCHPKGADTYDDRMEQHLLKTFEECGRKAVAWGEFGLDYSHPYYGKLNVNRSNQRKVFARQLQLAVSRGLPVVIHSRGADRDTIRILRKYVPRDHKVHMHSYRGSIQTLEAMLAGWTRCFVGFSGLITLDDAEIAELCRRCPLDRMLLETDAPYLPILEGNSSASQFSHPGQIPLLARRAAELKGCSALEVMKASRANARVMYGI